MPFQVVAKMEGMTQLVARLHDLKQGVRNRILRRALRAASRPIIVAARKYAPKRTGQLRRSIGVILRTYATGVVAAIIGVRKGFRVQIGGKYVNPEKYLHLVLLGRKAILAGSAKGKSTGKQALAFPVGGTVLKGYKVAGEKSAPSVWQGQEVLVRREVAEAAAQPFLQFAFESAKGESLRAASAVIAEELKKLASKARAA